MAARPYRALLFDVMGTLVYEPFLQVVPRSLGMTLDEILAAKHPTSWAEFERGEIDEATFRGRFFADGRSYPHERMKAAMVEAYAWLEGTEALLSQLKEAGHALHLFSNYPVWYRQIEDKLRISRYAAWTFVSCDTGVRKPDAEAYLGVARTLGVKPSELLFVDDRRVNCEAASDVGMDAIRFVAAAPLRDALLERGVL